jgi:hypothetical protein
MHSPEDDELSYDEEVDEFEGDDDDYDDEQYRLTLSQENVEKVRTLVCVVCRQPAARRCGTCRGSTYYCSGKAGEEHERHHRETSHHGDQCVPCNSSNSSSSGSSGSSGTPAPTCALCSDPGTLRCAVCNDTHYCSKEHQNEHLPQHKLGCYYSFEDMYMRQIADPALDDRVERFDQVCLCCIAMHCLLQWRELFSSFSLFAPPHAPLHALPFACNL